MDWHSLYKERHLVECFFQKIKFQVSLYTRNALTYNDIKEDCVLARQRGNKYAVKPENHCNTTITVAHLFCQRKTDDRSADSPPIDGQIHCGAVLC